MTLKTVYIVICLRCFFIDDLLGTTKLQRKVKVTHWYWSSSPLVTWPSPHRCQPSPSCDLRQMICFLVLKSTPHKYDGSTGCFAQRQAPETSLTLTSGCWSVVRDALRKLLRKDMKASSRQDLGSLARCRAERPRLADIRQHPLKVFSQPYQVVFISWSETGQARREFLSRCQSSGCISVSPVLYKSRPVPYRVSLQYTGRRRWWPTVTAPVTAALTESHRLHLIGSIKLSTVRECKSPKNWTDTTLNIPALFLIWEKDLM